MSALRSGQVIGILGGGQLGRLLAIEAARLGFDVHVYCPDPRGPALRVAAERTVAAYDDVAAVTTFAQRCDVVTYEFENVPLVAADAVLATGTPLRPGRKALEMSQDRLHEKQFLNEIGVPTTPFEAINDRSEVAAALTRLGGKGVLKHRRDGYDGKGQAVIARPDDLEHALGLCDAPCILEAWSPFVCEISAIVARAANGAVAIYDFPQNKHVDGVLRRSTLPADISPVTREAAHDAARKLADELDYVGVLALEFFVLGDGRLLANEFAPRVHNSGHWTPEACLTGQFEQHIRAIADWPLGPIDRVFDVEMRNLLGEEVNEIPDDLTSADKPVVYGKAEARPGRKMAHVTRRLKPA